MGYVSIHDAARQGIHGSLEVPSSDRVMGWMECGGAGAGKTRFDQWAQKVQFQEQERASIP